MAIRCGTGSPPPTRGTPKSSVMLGCTVWITPAHTGNTRSSDRICYLGQDHPRTYGEHYPRPLTYEHILGSPPHIRGTPIFSPFSFSCNGITPAHAGNTRVAGEQYALRWDHPRTCGEHEAMADGDTEKVGSPPHMRGTPIFSPFSFSCNGITPRTCGEHQMVVTSRVLSAGSPPHMRGTPQWYIRPSRFFRITPAHAGNTMFRSGRSSCPRDHPRTCGEHSSAMALKLGSLGSPPHMRGTPL